MAITCLKNGVPTPKISCFTPSFNKRQYVGQAIESVLNQTFTDFEYYLIENSTDDDTRPLVRRYIQDHRVQYRELNFTLDERRARYPTAVILNEFYPQAHGEFIFYLSDDDYFLPTCFERCMAVADSQPEHSVWYFTMDSLVQAGEGWTPITPLVAEHPRGLNTALNLDCAVDGGQVFHRRSVLDKLSQPYFADTYADDRCSHCDGLFLETIGKHYTFQPIKETLAVRRRTNISTFMRA